MTELAHPYDAFISVVSNYDDGAGFVRYGGLNHLAHGTADLFLPELAPEGSFFLSVSTRAPCLVGLGLPGRFKQCEALSAMAGWVTLDPMPYG